MTCEDEFLCSDDKTVLEKQISSTFYVSNGMGPTSEDRAETEHTKKVKDTERAIRKRKKYFGHDSVGDPNDKPDPRHIVKRGRTLGGQQQEVDKQEFIKAAAKDPGMVQAAKKALRKEN